MQKKPDVRTLPRNAQPKIMRPVIPGAKEGDDLSPRRKSAKADGRGIDPPGRQPWPSSPFEGLMNLDDAFRNRCYECYAAADFARPLSDERALAKADTLRELVRAVQDPSLAVDGDCASVFTLIAAHLYRAPRRPPAEWFVPDDYFFRPDEIF